MILIKKYQNRKLYNTDDSKYISLNEINKLIRSKTPFQVLENKTKTDITREVSVQALTKNLSEEEFLRLLTVIS